MTNIRILVVEDESNSDMHLPTKAAIVAILGDISIILTIVAGLPYELGAVSEFFPAKYKGWLTVSGVIATAGLKVTQRAMERLQGMQNAKQIEANKQAIAGEPPK